MRCPGPGRSGDALQRDDQDRRGSMTMVGRSGQSVDHALITSTMAAGAAVRPGSSTDGWTSG